MPEPGAAPARPAAPPGKSSTAASPDDPFGGASNDTGGGFADFSAFEPFSSDNAVGSSNSLHNSTENNRWGSAFSSATDQPKPDPFSGEGRYTGLDFCEDPFKNSNYRYGDPFDLENANADPFNEPFQAPQSDSVPAFGGKSDPFASSAPDPFSSENQSRGDPFASAFGSESSYENSSRIDPFSKNDTDPFSSSKLAPVSSDSSDPFGSSFTASFNTAVPNVDPFGSNNNFGSPSNDPFSLTNLRPPPQVPTSDINSNSTLKQEKVNSTTSTVSYRKEKASADSGESTTSKGSLKKKTSHSLSDFLTGSPLKSTEKADKSKEKKDKKHGKFHISSPLKTHKSKSNESPKSSSRNSTIDSSVDEVQMKMAAEVSRRSEDERRRKLQLQEEADLAYAIALSKAEAASLKSQ